MRGALVLVVAAIVANPGSARAGRSFYGWLYGPEVLPERSVELQQWVAEADDTDGDKHTKETALWWGPLIGVTDQLELALPIELAWTRSAGESPNFTLQRFGVEARYRFVTQDPVDRPDFAPLLRVAVKRDVTTRDLVRGEIDLVGAYDAGSVQVLVDLGMIGEVKSGSRQFEARPGLGVSVKAVNDLRLGFEGYAELSFEDSVGSWAIVGPDLAWTHGRFWLSAMAGIGIYHIKAAPRVMWGVLF